MCLREDDESAVAGELRRDAPRARQRQRIQRTVRITDDEVGILASRRGGAFVLDERAGA
jgi:hypothetical protein